MIFEAYSVGLCSASVCTSLSAEDAVIELNATIPTGITSPWALSDSSTFKGGEKNGCDCPDYPGNKHYLMGC